MHLVMNPKDPQVSVRLADEGFAPYVWCNDFSFEVRAYARADRHKRVERWPLDLITPYRKCYGIDPDEFASYRGSKDSDIFMAYLDNQPVGHVVVSTNWNGFAHVDELAVVASARRHGVAKSLLDVVKFWSHKKTCRESCWKPKTTTLAHAGCMSVAGIRSVASITCAIAA